MTRTDLVASPPSTFTRVAVLGLAGGLACVAVAAGMSTGTPVTTAAPAKTAPTAAPAAQSNRSNPSNPSKPVPSIPAATAPTPAAHATVSPPSATTVLAPGREVRTDAAATDTSRIARTFSVAALPTTARGVDLGLELTKSRRGDALRAALHLVPSGNARLTFARVQNGKVTDLGSIPMPGSVRAGQQVTLEAALVASTFRARAWTAGSSVPAFTNSPVPLGASPIQRSASMGVWLHLAPNSKNILVRISRVNSPAANPTPMPEAGSAPVGSARYPTPVNAFYVSPTGNDTNAGSISAPLRTVAKAVVKAPSGATIVLRAGSYHESVSSSVYRSYTIQNYPGEAAWFDGSSAVTGWTQRGTTWVHSGWTTEFDSTQGYSAAAAETARQNGWTWLDPNYPMAAHPDQVFVNGVALAQVSSAAAVVAGRFFVNYATDELVIGTNPAGATVRASDLGIALTLPAPGTVLRGVGVRYYGTSLPDIGTVRLRGDGASMQNVVIRQNAMQGLTVSASNVRLDHLTAISNGLLGLHANKSDGLRVTHVISSNNNTEHFGVTTPVGGGIKITSTRGASVTDSIFAGNINTNGVWFDVSSYNFTVTGNTVTGNGRSGVYAELSSVGVIADNYIVDNYMDQIRVADSNQVRIWNNTLGGGTSRTIEVVQDSRRASVVTASGHDSRQPLPDPTVTWITGDITIANNTFGSSGQFHVYVVDLSRQRTAAQMNVTIDGNLFSLQPAHYGALAWGKADGGYTKYVTATDINASRITGTHNAETTTSMTAAQMGQHAASAGNAQPLPAAIAALLGQATGTQHVGVF